MKKFIFLSLTFTILSCSVNLASKRLLSISNLLKMNKQQINGIKSISIENDLGFKYVKSDIKTKVFTSVSSTTATQNISDQDEEKLREVIEKYR